MTKGLSQTLWIVIGIVVFLVVALVILTIFGSSVSTFASISEADAFCQTKLATSCAATGNKPIDWGATNIKLTDGTTTSCETRIGAGTCPDAGGTGGADGGAGAGAGGTGGG